MHSVLSLLERDIDRLKTEIESYRSEKDLWKLEGSIANAPGNLCLHLTGGFLSEE